MFIDNKIKGCHKRKEGILSLIQNTLTGRSLSKQTKPRCHSLIGEMNTILEGRLISSLQMIKSQAASIERPHKHKQFASQGATLVRKWGGGKAN